MNHYIKKPFNIVEIVLAIGVIGIGLASVMALFPVGSNAMRDAMATGYSANMADQMLHQLEQVARNNWSGVIDTGGSNKFLRDGYPSSPASTLEDFDYSGAGVDCFDTPRKTIYYESGSNDGVYKILSFSDKDGDGERDSDETVDFQAIMVLWKKRIDINGDGSRDSDDPPLSMAAELHAEVSWPAQRPYGQRETSTYRLELFNRN